MKTNQNIIVKSLLLFSLLALCSCSEEFDVTPERSEFSKLDLQFDGLPNLGYSYVYEGWIIVDGKSYSTGIFKIDEDGKASKNLFLVDAERLNAATSFVLTIEPQPDNDPSASQTHIIGGSFSGNVANLSIDHSSAFNTDFLSSEGTFILATPTNGDGKDENSGIWWLNPAGPNPSLSIPSLTSGWKYEGWVVIDNIPVSTGTFTKVMEQDDHNRYGANLASPPFPGEDFLFNPPNGLVFPLDLSGSTAVISIEPDPDNSTAPFLLKPLIGSIPNGATDHISYPMGNNMHNTMITGVASK